MKRSANFTFDHPNRGSLDTTRGLLRIIMPLQSKLARFPIQRTNL